MGDDNEPDILNCPCGHTDWEHGDDGVCLVEGCPCGDEDWEAADW